MKHWLIWGLLFLALCGCAPPCSEDPGCTRILFIGNSYTYFNDLPKTFKKLAESGGQRVETGMEAPGGWALDDHVNSTGTLQKIRASGWDYIVLQEQSQTPASELLRTVRMYPAARTLAAEIKQAGAQTIFFVTWAHRDGWLENGINDYKSMQLMIDNGYLNIAREIGAIQAPVGYAWLTAWQQNPELNLWQDDGSHPNEKGTYLAACVFYATLFQKSPEGLSYRGSLSKDESQTLQKIAGEAVLNYKNHWNLPELKP